MGADQFTVENGLAAQALQAATVSPIAAEPWTDGSALLFSATDGRLHPVPVQPVAGAIVSVTGIAPIAVSPGVAPMVSLSGIVDEAHGGLGFDVSTLGTGLLKRTAPAVYTTVADSLTVSAGAGLSGGGSVSLGGSTSLSLPNVGPGAGAIAYPTSVTLDDQGRVSAATPGSAPPALPLSRANGGLGSDVSALSTGLLAQTASNLWAVRSIAAGSGVSVTNGDGVLGNPTVGLTSNSVTINTSGGVVGGGAVALGGSLSLSLSAVPNSALANSSVTITPGTGLAGGGAVSLGGSTSLNIDSTVATLTGTQVLTNKTISGASNTLSNIGNSSLTNSSVTVSAGTGLSGGGAMSLGGSTSLSVSYGTTAGTAAQGNDARLPPAPSSAGRMLYDNASAWTALTAGTPSQVLVGGSAPAFGSVPAAAITALTGTVSGTVTLSGAVTLNSATLGGNLAAGSNKVTGLGAGSAAGDSLRFEQGGGVPVCFYLNTAQGWSANAYLGIGGDGSSTVNVNVVPFPVPQAGTIKNLRVQGLTNAGTNTTITIYKATSAVSPTYSATALTCLVSSGTATGNDTTHSVSVSAGDLLVAFSNASWAVNGCAVSFIYLPG